MERALLLARIAKGRVSPNPAVGAVIVRDGRIVGEGYTLPPGQAHAERVALARAGDEARGATLFVSLEPCPHVGRTPPCVDAIIAAGIREVIVATPDFNPLVSGKGIARLREAGIAVHLGEHGQEARRLNEDFFKWSLTGTPLVIAKYAMTLDGRIATRTGHSRWITGEAARRHVHELRDQVDALLVGRGTVVADDPALTTRLEGARATGLPEVPFWPRPGGQPPRVIVDSKATLPLSARVLQPDLPGRTLVVVTDLAGRDRVAALQATGAEIVEVPHWQGQVDLEALFRLLGKRDCISVMVEGGSAVLGNLFDRHLADKVMAYLAPKVVGGARAPGPLGGQGAATMADAAELRGVEVQPLGADLLVTGYTPWSPAPDFAAARATTLDGSD